MVFFLSWWIHLQPDRYLAWVSFKHPFSSTICLFWRCFCVVGLDLGPFEVRLKMMARWHWSAWPVIIKRFSECTLDGANLYSFCWPNWKKARKTWCCSVFVSRFWRKKNDCWIWGKQIDKSERSVHEVLILQGAETMVFFFQTRMERVLVRDELSLNIVFKACYQRLPKVL